MTTMKAPKDETFGGRLTGRPAVAAGPLAELGFAELHEYLRDRCVGRGWSVRRLYAELGVSHGWLDQQLTRLGST
jgi:hypothetical protein